MDDWGLILRGDKDRVFFFRHRVQTSSAVHSASNPTGKASKAAGE